METIDDILREMREFADEQEKDNCYDLREMSTDSFRAYADLIEKALEVERIEWRKMLKEAKDAIRVLEERCDENNNCYPRDEDEFIEDLKSKGWVVDTDINVGSNAAKMREALERILNLAYIAKEDGGRITNDWLIDTCKTALSAPPRNCDVGTAEEQGARFRGFCDKHNCERCPVGGDEYLTNCFSRWSQMPYEKGETK